MSDVEAFKGVKDGASWLRSGQTGLIRTSEDFQRSANYLLGDNLIRKESEDNFSLLKEGTVIFFVRYRYYCNRIAMNSSRLLTSNVLNRTFSQCSQFRSLILECYHN